MHKLLFLVLIAFATFTSSEDSPITWNGVDMATRRAIEIGTGNLVRSGNDIEIFDFSYGNYRNVEVQSITYTGSGAELEVYDYEADKIRVFEME